MFETGGSFSREAFITYNVHQEYPFNALQVYHVNNGYRCAKDRARAFEEFVERSINDHEGLSEDERKEIIDRIISKFKMNGIVVYNDNDPEYAREVYSKINNFRPHTEEYLTENDTVMEMAYGRTQYYKFMSSISGISSPEDIKIDSDKWTYLNDAIAKKDKNLATHFFGIFNLSDLYRKNSLIIDLYNSVKDDPEAKLILSVLIRELGRNYKLPTVLWQIKLLESSDNPEIIEAMKSFFIDYAYLYFPELFKKSPAVMDEEFVVYYKVLKVYNESITPLDVYGMYNHPDYSSLKENLEYIKGYMKDEWAEEYEKFCADMSYFPYKNSDLGKFLYSDDFFGLLTLGEEAYQAFVTAMINSRIENEPVDIIDEIEEEDLSTLEHDKYFDNVSEILPDGIGVDILKFYNINKIEDLEKFSKRFFHRLYPEVFNSVVMELLAYKMRDAGVNFLTEESYKTRLMNSKPSNIKIQELYGSGIISVGLFGTLADCGVKFVSDIDGLITDYISMTVGMINELKGIADHYHLRVYTSDEFVENVIKTGGVGIPVTHLLKYFGDSGDNLYINDEYINALKGNNPVLYIHNLFDVTFKEFMAMGKEHPFVQNILVKLQEKIPQINYRLALTVKSESDVSYPKEINDSKGFFKDLEIDRNSDGVINRKELEDFVLKKMNLFDIKALEITEKDPSEMVNLITDILWKMPEFGSALFDKENASESFAYARKVIIDNKEITMHTLKDILFSKEQFGYVLIMMLIQYTLACADSDSIDPFS